ncbi:GATA zinc finger domain-containing protein 9 [Talaromyces islandicus]|uniref:GATA zinc finger domain-containing protein 9 n=1 Tax=Talaromyces islandicus TaxID=28573 RepID=A0A0U1LU56_TALIS|nr:GATA zinc finger domain-containing protein 9 [Talaromyces islandicus]
MATGVSVNPAPLSSSAMYPGPPPSYSYASNPIAPPPSHSLSPAPRRSMELDKDSSQSQPPRQSLPSIHEALGNENHLPYPGHPSSGAPSHSAHHPPPPNVLSRPSAEGPPGPPNPFSNTTTSVPFLRESQYHAQQHSPAPADPSRSSLVSLSTQDSRKQSLQSVSGKSPTTSIQTAPTSISTSQYDYSAPTSVIASPNTYGGSSQPYSWPSQSATSQPGSYDSRSYNGNCWKASNDPIRVDDKNIMNRSGGPITQPHSDSVKRQLDSYDVESSLAEIIDGSTKTVDFSKHYATRAHQAQRSGPVLGSLPSVHEIDDLLQVQQRNHEALMRIRNAVLSQEQALAEQRAQRRERIDPVYEDGHVGLYQDGFKSPTGLTGGDAKKRRGKAAPPGRCHSCNRAETPEWRRGPDGARTLCNACGLHYAKLTRKMGANKAAALGSNLKPKSLDSSSPVHR